MAYLGKVAGNRHTATSKDSFNGDGSTTAFTMTKTVHLVTDIEVFVDNVQQEPTTAYTISGTTLTFDEAPPNGTANVYVIHRSGNNDSFTIQDGTSPTFNNVTIINDGNIGSAGDSDAIAINSSGRVTLSNNLTVDGTSTLTGNVTVTGNIDIDGTANLDAVDVDGAVNFAADVTFANGADIITASAGTSNFRAGVNAGNSILAGGNYNTVVGDEAGTAITTGDQNTAVGYQALDAVVTGYDNTAIGDRALSAHTGFRTTAVGCNALAANTTDNYGVAVGYAALASNTTGTLNTAVGGFALNNNDGVGGGGDYNTAMGYGALFTNTEGNTNTAMGYYANFANTTGSNNTGIGYNSNGAVTDGEYNTSIGSASGDTTTTGDYNVCLGYATDVSAVGAANQISIGTNVACSENSQVSIGQSGSRIRNEFDTDAAWTQSSDVRKKKDIEDAVLGLSFVNDLRPVTYKWKPNNEFPKDFAEYNEENFMTLDVTMHGLVAQEVKVALDKTGVARFAGWKEDADGSQRISKEMFVLPLIKAVQELSAKNDALEARIKTLEDA